MPGSPKWFLSPRFPHQNPIYASPPSLFRCLGRTKVSVQVLGKRSCLVAKPVSTVRVCQHLAQPPSWRTTPCRLSATALHTGGRGDRDPGVYRVLVGKPLVGFPRLYIRYIRSYPPYWRPFLHPQPEDAPCRGDGPTYHGY